MPSKFSSADQDTVVAKDLQIRGHLKSEGNLFFDGVIVGNITSTGDITLGVNAYVEGNITGRNLTVAGRVKGNLHLDEQLKLQHGAQVEGDVRALGLAAEEGSVINGHFKMPLPKLSEDVPLTPETEATES